MTIATRSTPELQVAMRSKAVPIKGLRTRKRLLVVEDEPDLAELLSYNMQRAGYEVTVVHDGRSAVAHALAHRPDLIVLDLMLPELSGIEVATKVRTSAPTSAIPIIMVTARAEEVDQLAGLATGADDYVTKPFSMKVLLARVEALLRRSPGSPTPANVLRLDDIEINGDTHEVRVRDQAVSLTLTEFRLLECLLQAGGKVLSRGALMDKVMGPEVMVTERTIDVHVTAIRRKLGDAGRCIRTVRGVGYRAISAAD